MARAKAALLLQLLGDLLLSYETHLVRADRLEVRRHLGLLWRAGADGLRGWIPTFFVGVGEAQTKVVLVLLRHQSGLTAPLLVEDIRRQVWQALVRILQTLRRCIVLDWLREFRQVLGAGVSSSQEVRRIGSL